MIIRLSAEEAANTLGEGTSFHLSDGDLRMNQRSEAQLYWGSTRQEIAEEKVCRECGCSDLIEDEETGETICRECGYVVSSKVLDHGPEWRAFNLHQREKLSRVGAPLNLMMHDHGLSTVIDWRDVDYQGRKFKPEQRIRVRRLRKWNRRSKISGSTQRNLTYALAELTKISYKLNLPKNVLETASVIYRRIVKKNMIRGRSIIGMVAASVYMACRQCAVIRSLDEIADVTQSSRKVCGRNYRYLLKKMKIDVPPARHQKYVSKYVSHLTLSGEAESLALEILEWASELRLTVGRGPSGIAAACTYIAGILTCEKRTQSDVAKTANVTEVTIRNRYKELLETLHIRIEM
jgi:transcription initiation factor TFIIB